MSSLRSQSTGSSSAKGEHRSSSVGKSPRRRREERGCSPGGKKSHNRSSSSEPPSELLPLVSDPEPAAVAPSTSKTKMVVLAGVNLFKKITHLSSSNNHNLNHNLNNNNPDAASSAAAATAATAAVDDAVSACGSSGTPKTQKKRAKERDKRIDVELTRLNSKITGEPSSLSNIACKVGHGSTKEEEEMANVE